LKTQIAGTHKWQSSFSNTGIGEFVFHSFFEQMNEEIFVGNCGIWYWAVKLRNGYLFPQ
jgi:hypothetical protein